MNQKLKKENPILKVFFLLVLATIVSPVLGDPIDENTARQVASQTLSQSSATHSVDNATQVKAQAVPQKTVQLLYKSSSINSENTNTTKHNTKTNVKETIYFYVFGTENNEGFVIVAGDDRVTPILGYSDTNGFDADNMPPNLQWWLGEYAKQIQFAIDNNIEATPEVKLQWAQYLDNNNNLKED